MASDPVSFFLGQQLVDIFVGQERMHFSIHKNLLCRSGGDYFAEALGENSVKQKYENYLELPEDDPIIFHLFCIWMYSGDLKFGNDIENHHIALIQIWLFAQKYQNEHLMNHCMDVLQDTLHLEDTHLSCAEMQMIFNTTEHDKSLPLRRFALALLSFASCTKKFDKWPAEMYMKSSSCTSDVISFRRGMKLWLKCDPRVRQEHPRFPRGCYVVCYFHVHNGTQKCMGPRRPRQGQTPFILE